MVFSWAYFATDPGLYFRCLISLFKRMAEDRRDQAGQHAADQGGKELRPGKRRRDRAELRRRDDDRGHQPDEDEVQRHELCRGSQHHASVCRGQLLFLQEFADEQPKQDGVDGVAQRNARYHRQKRRADAEQIRAERRKDRDRHAGPDTADQRRDRQHQIDARAGHQLAEAFGKELNGDQKRKADRRPRDPCGFFIKTSPQACILLLL